MNWRLVGRREERGGRKWERETERGGGGREGERERERRGQSIC